METFWRGPRYRDRDEAGSVLASRLVGRKGGCVVLAIPNGGVAVGVPVARSLGCPLRLLVVRKMQIPGMTEAGFGAVSADGTMVLDERVLAGLDLEQPEIEAQKERALQSVRRRVDSFGSWARFPALEGKTAILVDDGLATGSTMEAGIRIVRAHRPQAVVVAVPTSSRRAYLRLEPLVEELVCPHVSRTPIFAVADAYEDWYDLTDEEVLQLLESLSGRPENPESV
jgi:putative phosphoribosyl transferase